MPPIIGAIAPYIIGGGVLFWAERSGREGAGSTFLTGIWILAGLLMAQCTPRSRALAIAGRFKAAGSARTRSQPLALGGRMVPRAHRWFGRTALSWTSTRRLMRAQFRRRPLPEVALGFGLDREGIAWRG